MGFNKWSIGQMDASLLKRLEVFFRDSSKVSHSIGHIWWGSSVEVSQNLSAWSSHRVSLCWGLQRAHNRKPWHRGSLHWPRCLFSTHDKPAPRPFLGRHSRASHKEWTAFLCRDYSNRNRQLLFYYSLLKGDSRA